MDGVCCSALVDAFPELSCFFNARTFVQLIHCTNDFFHHNNFLWDMFFNISSAQRGWTQFLLGLRYSLMDAVGRGGSELVCLAQRVPAGCSCLAFSPSTCLDTGGDSLTLCFCWNSSALPISCYLIISSKFIWPVT